MKKGTLLALQAFFLFIFPFVSCTSKTEKMQTERELFLHQSASKLQSYLDELNLLQAAALDAYVESLSLEDKISQLFIENLEGNTSFRTFEKKYELGGGNDNQPLVAGAYLFFSVNLTDNPEQTMNFTASIFGFCRENNLIPPFLAIDQEGGFVNRLKNLCGPLPSCQKISEKLDLEQAYELYSLQAKQMELLGFNMNLAPVAEVCTPDNEVFLNERSFGDSSKVLSYGRSCILAYQQNKISTVLKHFPGNTNTDPHTGLPEIQLSKDELEATLEPFYKLMDFYPHGILMSHARTTAFNSEVPSCLSSFWVTDVLRNRCGYKGIIFSDDIFMAALAENSYPPEKAVIMAINAGVDCIMTSERRFVKPARYVYKEASENPDFLLKINAAVKRIILYKIDLGLLEFASSENAGKNCLKIQINNSYLNQFYDIEKRLSNFESVKNQNIRFYQEHFVAEKR